MEIIPTDGGSVFFFPFLSGLLPLHVSASLFKALATATTGEIEILRKVSVVREI